MDLRELQAHWTAFGAQDPLWAILTDPAKKGGRWSAEEFFATGREYVSRVLQHLASLGLEPRRGKALDFGCGVGRITQALADHFAAVTGVDIAASMLRHAEAFNRHGHRCRYLHNQDDHLRRFGAGTFDFVITVLVLQHMRPEYVRGYLAELVRVLDPRGVLLFQLPEPRTDPPRRRWSPFAWLRRWRAPIPRMEMHGVARADVVLVVEGAGGRVADVHEDGAAGPGWVSYTYVVTKRGTRLDGPGTTATGSTA